MMIETAPSVENIFLFLLASLAFCAIVVLIGLILNDDYIKNVGFASGCIFTISFLSCIWVETETRQHTYKQAIKDMHNCELKYEMHVLPNKDTVFYKKEIK